MEKQRLQQLAGIINEDVELSQLDPLDYSTPEVAKFVAEHLWHEYKTDEGVNKFIAEVKRALVELRKRGT